MTVMTEKSTLPGYMRLLDPEALAKIHRLELVARGIVEGFISGRHRSPYRGFSVEFAEHREYSPGDSLRDLDWRVYGKTDRYFIKQYMEETNLRSVILLDASGSMKYTGEEAAPHQNHRLSKFEYAQYLAASLAHLMINQQDAVGLVTFDTQIRRYFPARSRTNYLRTLLEEISDTKPGEETRMAPLLHDIAERVHRRGLIIIISDLFDNPEEILKALHHFRFRKHEVIVFHIMAEEELTFPFDKWSLFRDMEAQENRIELDPSAIRAAYLDEVRRFVSVVEKGCGQMSIDYVPISTKRPFDMALTSYLAHRRFKVK
jgi:uncharacterized protein (DUF58 family)